MFFDEVIEGPPDAVFGMTGTFLADPRPQKVNLLVGVYKNEELKNELMPAVARARAEIKTDQVDYLPIDGSKEMIEAIGPLVFGKGVWASERQKIYGAQSVGGTGALRVGAEFLCQEAAKTIYLPQPTWPNHPQIFERAHCKVKYYPYYDRSKRRFDLSAFLAFLQKLPLKSAILFHAACHNPTGCDPTPQEWTAIAKEMQRSQLLPVFDFAYQGLGDDLERDAAALRHFVSEGSEVIVAYSCSKNFSLYCQRVGALFVVCGNAAVKLKVASQIKRIIRALYSNPPAWGALLVTQILTGPLRSEWERELSEMRGRLQAMRTGLAERLAAKMKRDFQQMLDRKGMFAVLDLEKSQVQELIDRHAVYMLENGRISIAGLNAKNLDYVADSLAQVMR